MHNDFAPRIIKLRNHFKMGTCAFADRIQIDNTTMYRWERGESHPNYGQLLRIYKTTGVSLDWLVAGCGTMFPTVART